jgi:hypothetical protein
MMIQRAQHGQPATALLAGTAIPGLLITPAMQDVAPLKEVGVPKISEVELPATTEFTVRLPADFQKGPLEVLKLTINESGVTAESGFTLRTKSGKELVIVAGAFPYTLAIFLDNEWLFDSQPEYDMSKYKRIALS